MSRGIVAAVMIEVFLRWWAQHLLAWVPRRLRGDGVRPDAVIAEILPGEGGLAIHVRRKGHEAPLGRFPLDASGEDGLRRALGRAFAARRGPLLLRPPPQAALQRVVEVPIAAERDLDQVLRYDLDRLTPFAEDELYWGWIVQQRDRARGKLHVLLLLAMRAGLEPALAALRRAGAMPAALEVAGAPRTIPLDPARPRSERRRRRALAAAAIGCAILAFIAIALPFVLQSIAMHGLERRMAALQPQVDRVHALQRRIASESAGADALVAQRRASGDALHMLARVTQVLPDDTHLTELVLRARVLTITGQSAAAARLIAALSSDPAFRDPVFVAPVTRDEVAHADEFSIRADVAPGGGVP